MNIVLIGYRGAGKTCIGKKLSSMLWNEFVDTDVLIVDRAGTTIKDIFETRGEAAFRALEAAVIQEVSAKDNQVIAVGGGAILRPENVAALKKNGKLIWLRAGANTLYARIEADAARGEGAQMRPNLTSVGGLEEVQKVLEERTPLYEAAADATLEVTYLNVEEAAKRLVLMV